MTTSRSTHAWVLNEFKDISYGDKRLDKRFITIACDSLENPGASINHASEDWAATKGAYRFFSNPKASKEKIIESHKVNTINRMKEHKIILAIQDSSYLDFTNHTKLKGKGPIGTRQQNLTGYVMHSTLAISADGLPLGLLTHELWAREEIKENRNSINRKLPVEEKESYKWIKALKEVSKIEGDFEIINICDRESDFYNFFETAKILNQKVIVRARYDREIERIDDDAEESKNSMWAFMQEQPVCFQQKIEITRNHVHAKGKNKQEFRESRIAETEVKVGQVTFKPPCGSSEKESLKYNLVFVKEINVPEGTVPTEWMIITSLSIDSVENISKIINYYRLRWSIEEYHKILKSGCKIEDCLLEDTESMFRYITLLCIIAWRLFWITRLQRINPDRPCTEGGLSDTEWKGLYCYLHRTKEIPDKIPSIKEATIWIARLGGFLARKGDGDPGIITMWRGLTRLNDIIETYSLFL